MAWAPGSVKVLDFALVFGASHVQRAVLAPSSRMLGAALELHAIDAGFWLVEDQGVRAAAFAGHLGTTQEGACPLVLSGNEVLYASV